MPRPRPRSPVPAALVAIAAAVSALAAAASRAEGYPARPVQIVVPYTPGTGADLLSRLLGPVLARRWGVPVVTENRSGATGNIGAEAVAHAAPDGQTLLFTATSFGINPALGARLGFDPVRSFAPVVLVATSGMALVAAPSVPARDFREFVALARAQPGRMYYASPGSGGPQHLAMELIKLEAGIDLVHVPYKGSGGAISDLVGGHVQAMVVSLQTIAPQVQSGRLHMLAVLGDRRAAAFPEVGTTAEAGYARLRIDTWYGLFAPAGTPPAAIAAVNEAVNAALRDLELREALERQGMQSAGGTPARLGELLASELARWSKVVAAAHITAD